jgi:hypothetical protein
VLPSWGLSEQGTEYQGDSSEYSIICIKEWYGARLGGGRVGRRIVVFWW